MMSIQGRLQEGLQERINTRIYHRKKIGPKERLEARAAKNVNTLF